MKKGFLEKNKPTEQKIKILKHPPMMFKIDFTIDTDGNFRIYELGHPFSDQNGGLEDNICNLVKKLWDDYDHVYISGDYPEVKNIIKRIKQKNGRPPQHQHIDELINIRTENSIVIIREKESPTYYSPYCVQEKLRRYGSNLVVFGAEPLACLSAYEKIIMQRLQIHIGTRYPIPSVLINLALGQDVCSQFESQISEQYPFLRANDDASYMIKPAFSSCGSGVQYAGKKAETIHRLQELQKKYTAEANNYQRTAEDFIGMLFVGKNGQTKELQKRKEEVFSFVQNNALHSIIEDVDMQAKPDPFIIVQQAVFTPCVLHNNKRWQPMYRTFILIKDTRSSVKIELLEKIAVFFPKKPLSLETIDTDSIVAGLLTSGFYSQLNAEATENILKTLNNEENKNFFNAIFRNSTSFIENTLTETFPELKKYWRAIIAYPPYQRMLNKTEKNNEIRRYEGLVMIFQIQYWLEISKHSESQLHCLMSLINTYKRIYSQNPQCHTYIDFFARTTRQLLKKINPTTISSIEKKEYLESIIGVLGISGDLIKYTSQSIALTILKSYLEEVPRIFSTIYPCFNQHNPLELMSKKHARETVIEYTGQLCSLEQTLREQHLLTEEIETELSPQKNHFLHLSMCYFNVVSVYARRILIENQPST